MRHIRASIRIGAPPEAVWDLYADVEGVAQRGIESAVRAAKARLER